MKRMCGREGRLTWSGFAATAVKTMVGMLVLFGCCGKASAAGELRLYIWSEYIDPAIVKDFEKKFGCKVLIDLYESNEEMTAKLIAGGVSQYDIVVPSGYAVKSMIEQNLLMKIDKSKVPNLKNIDPKFTKLAADPGDAFSVPYQWGTIGIMYRKDKVKNFVPSWKMIFDDKTLGPFILMDSTREMIGSALIYLGKSLNTTNKDDLLAAAKVLLAAKKDKNFKGFEGGIGGKNQIIAGTAAMAVVYNGDAVRGMADNPNAAFVNPVEGGLIWVDSMGITAKAPNADLAHKFIDYILDPKVGAQLSNFNRYPTPNAASIPMIRPEDLKNPAIYPDARTKAKLQFLDDLGKDNRIYDEVWTMIKSR